VDKCPNLKESLIDKSLNMYTTRWHIHGSASEMKVRVNDKYRLDQDSENKRSPAVLKQSLVKTGEVRFRKSKTMELASVFIYPDIIGHLNKRLEIPALMRK
jgi:hypothetical protein